MALRSDWSDRNCPIARSLDVVGDPWVLMIMQHALSGLRRYDEFREEMGIADTVLSRRLSALVEAGLLRRSPYRDGNRTRQEYLLTEAGADLLPVINSLVIWGETHRPHPDPEVTMQIVHDSCGRVSSTPQTCSECGVPMPPEAVIWRKSWRSPADLHLVGVSSAAPAGDPRRESGPSPA